MPHTHEDVRTDAREHPRKSQEQKEFESVIPVEEWGTECRH